jgi:membrane protease YdiL (CAAX protease family)
MNIHADFLHGKDKLKGRLKMMPALDREEMSRETEHQPGPFQQFIEVSIFVFLILPGMVYSFFIVQKGKITFGFEAIATIINDLTLVALIFYFIWRNRESFKQIGLYFRRAGLEIIIGAVIFVPFTFAMGFVERAFQAGGLSAPSQPAQSLMAKGGIWQSILGIILVIIVAFSEETIFRGYLIRRFRMITSSPLVAVLLSSLIFSLGHRYEGTAGVATVFVMGVIFAVIYLWRKSLVAPMVMHFLQDFIGIVLLPMIGSG